MVAKQVTGTGVVELDGAWFVDDVSRVDGQQHALSGLLLAERLLAESAATTRSTAQQAHTRPRTRSHHDERMDGGIDRADRGA